MVQDDAAAAAVALKPQGATFVPLEALPARAGRTGTGRICIGGSAGMWCAAGGRLAAVVFYPVRDRVAGVGGLVAGPA